jgi:hypothetical protein
MTPIIIARIGRGFAVAALTAPLLLPIGCASSPETSGGVRIPLLSNSRDKALAKEVEADSFPTATQAGVQTLPEKSSSQ